jgi:hypothetical protein
VGLSHPHDGWDPNENENLHPYLGRYYLWFGDSVQSAMSYQFGFVKFSTFDRDNLNRDLVGRLLDRANEDTAAVLDGASSDPAVMALLENADHKFTNAVALMRTRQWADASTAAFAGYWAVEQAAHVAGVHVSHHTPAPTSASRGRPHLERPHPKLEA